MVVNDNGGSAVAGDFTVTVTGGHPVAGELPRCGRARHERAARRGRLLRERQRAGGLRQRPGCGLRGRSSSRTWGAACTITHDDRPGHADRGQPGRERRRRQRGAGGVHGDRDRGRPVAGELPRRRRARHRRDAGRGQLRRRGERAGRATRRSWRPDCSGVIALGETRTCTITSDDDPPATPTCNGKAATIVGGPGPSDIRGTAGNDVIVDLDGNNIVRGRGGSDTVCTGAGNDQVLAGDGADAIIDTGGRNVIQGAGGADVIRTAAGDDTINAGAGADTVTDAGGTNSRRGRRGERHDHHGRRQGRDRLRRRRRRRRLGRGQRPRERRGRQRHAGNGRRRRRGRRRPRLRHLPARTRREHGQALRERQLGEPWRGRRPPGGPAVTARTGSRPVAPDSPVRRIGR